MIDTSLKFQVQFRLNDTPDKSITIYDLTTYPFNGIAQADADILYRLTDPNGLVMYCQSAKWAIDDFSTPDIDRNATDFVEDLTLTVDADDNPIQGEYTFEAKLKGAGATVYSNSKTFTLDYTSPTIVIDMSANIKLGTLTSTDSTEYDVNDITPSITRSHRIVKPASATGCSIPAVATTTDAVRTIGGGATEDLLIWTGYWDADISSVLVYNMELWGTDVWIKIYDTVVGADTLLVRDDGSYLIYINGVNNIYTRYTSAVTAGNKFEAEKMHLVLMQLNSCWLMYEWNTQNGTDAEIWAERIKDLVTSNTSYTYTLSDQSHPVIPYGFISGTGASLFSFSYGVGDPAGGDPGDWYLKTDGATTAELFYNSGGNWTSVVSIMGTAGSNGADYSPILYCNTTGWASLKNALQQSVAQFTIPADTWHTDGDYVDISAHFAGTFSPSATEVLFGMILEDPTTATYTIKTYRATLNGTYVLRARIMRMSDTRLNSYAHTELWASGGSSNTLTFKDEKTVHVVPSLTANAMICKLTAQKDLDGAPGDITCDYILIEKRITA